MAQIADSGGGYKLPTRAAPKPPQQQPYVAPKNSTQAFRQADQQASAPAASSPSVAPANFYQALQQQRQAAAAQSSQKVQAPLNFRQAENASMAAYQQQQASSAAFRQADQQASQPQGAGWLGQLLRNAGQTVSNGVGSYLQMQKQNAAKIAGLTQQAAQFYLQYGGNPSPYMSAFAPMLGQPGGMQSITPQSNYPTADQEAAQIFKRNSDLGRYAQVGQALYPYDSPQAKSLRGDYSWYQAYVDQNNPGFDTEKRYFYNPAQYNWNPPIPDTTGTGGNFSGGGSGYGSGYGRRGGGGGGYGGGGYGGSSDVANFYNALTNWKILQVQGG